MTSMPEPLPLWDDEPDDWSRRPGLDPQRPAHIDPAKCGTNHTNYRYGCRCQACSTYHATALRKHASGIRTCKSCGTEFHMRHGEAGNKYCSTACKQIGYAQQPWKNEHTCQHPDCQSTYTASSKKNAPGGTSNRYGLCPPCRDRMRKLPGMSSLRQHHAPLALCIRLERDPTCDICGTDLTTRTRRPTGGTMLQLVVDHDHDCCPGDKSCGNCIRGIVCHRCNHTLGHAKNNPDILRAAADYLDRWAQ